MKSKKRLLIVLLQLSLLSCENLAESRYQIRIISAGNAFYGEYTIDGEEDYLIEEYDSENDEGEEDGKIYKYGNYYVYEKDLDNPESVYMKVDGYDLNAAAGCAQTTRIAIEIYDGDEMVEDNYISASSEDTHLYLTQYYDFTADDDEEDDDDDDDDDDDE